MATQAIDFQAIKQVQKRIWSAGDFARVAAMTTIVGEELCEAVDVVPGERVLDVACGSGNGALAAARRTRGGTVGVDFVPELLEHGRRRAAAERLEVDFVEGDTEQLPFEDASFDVVISIFGAMYAPDQERAAAEMLRVCCPGGRIGLANWTPHGFVGQAQKAIANYIPPLPGVRASELWGTEPRLRELLGDGIAGLEVTGRQFTFRFRSAEEWLEFFRANFGPVRMAFERLDDGARKALAADAKALLERTNRAGSRALAVPAEYLQVIATRA